MTIVNITIYIGSPDRVTLIVWGSINKVLFLNKPYVYFHWSNIIFAEKSMDS